MGIYLSYIFRLFYLFVYFQGFFSTIAYYKIMNIVPHVLIIQSCLTLCNPMDRSPSGFSVLRISQAEALEWVVISVVPSAIQ